MLLPELRTDLDLMPSPVTDRPGLLMRDFFRYSSATLIIPPPLVQGLPFFNGSRTLAELEVELAKNLGADHAAATATQLMQALSEAGFLLNDIFYKLKRDRISAFEASRVRASAHAGSAYPAEIAPLKAQLRDYLGESAVPQPGIMAIAAPHVSPEGGWQSYGAAYKHLTPELRDRTFVILGTSHYGQPDHFGLTAKRYATPLGETSVALDLVNELAGQPAAQQEDYCHAVEHSIEFQVVFLQSVYGAGVRILPILCGGFAKSIRNGGIPEDNRQIAGFLEALRSMAEREQDRLFWVLGVDMAHIGIRYGDKAAAVAEHGRMTEVRERDLRRIERINAADVLGFWKLVQESQDDLRWCGSSPFYTFLRAVPGAKGTLQHYQQWNIDERSVVTFAGIIFENGSVPS